METYNLYTLKLKLQRHNIAFHVSSSESIVIEGVHKILMKVILLIVLPIVIGLSMIIFDNVLELGFLEPCGFVILLASGFGIQVVHNSKKKNKYRKIIKDGKLEIQSKDSIIELAKAEISELRIEIKMINQDQHEGIIDVVYGDKSSTLLCIYGENEKLLRQDLNYIKGFIEQKLNVD
jgi:hypothetical protein